MSIHAVVNSCTEVTAMIDNGCCTFALVNERLVRKEKLPRILITPIEVEGVGNQRSTISEITEFTLDVGGVREQQVAAYITASTYDYDMILRKTWLESVGGVIDTEQKLVQMKRYGVSVRSSEVTVPLDCYPVSAVAFQYHVRKSQKKELGLQVFAASIKDI